MTYGKSCYKVGKFMNRHLQPAPDSPTPFIHCPADVTAELPSTQNFVRLKLPQPKANVDWWGYVDADPIWAKNLEGDFLHGLTAITFKARDPSNSTTTACTFTVDVKDKVRPVVENCPDNFEVFLLPYEPNRAVTWAEPNFVDNVGIESVTKSKLPGTVLGPGNHLITYSAVDTSGNRATCSFTIAVKSMSSIGFHPKRNQSSLPRDYLLMCPHFWAIRAELYAHYRVSILPWDQNTKLTPGSTVFQSVAEMREHRTRHHKERTRNGGTNRSSRPIYSVSSLRPMNDDPGLASFNVTLELRASQKSRTSLPWVVQHTPQQKAPPLWQDKAPLPSPVLNDEEKTALRRSDDEDSRMRRYEIELIKWRENMRRYHMEVGKLREDSRRYSTG